VCYGVSERRVCGVLGMCRNTCRYQRLADEQAALRIRLCDLAYSRASYGYQMLHILLARGLGSKPQEGLPDLQERMADDAAEETEAARYCLPEDSEDGRDGPQ
jgi:hypothetical protein